MQQDETLTSGKVALAGHPVRQQDPPPRHTSSVTITGAEKLQPEAMQACISDAAVFPARQHLNHVHTRHKTTGR